MRSWEAASTSAGQDSGYGVSQRSSGGAAGGAGGPDWEIQTDAERYVKSLGEQLLFIGSQMCGMLMYSCAERKLAKKKAGKRSTAAVKTGASLTLSDNDEEASNDGDNGVHEDDVVDDNETTCLLYDAARQHRAVQRARQESIDFNSSPQQRSRSSSPAPAIHVGSYDDGDEGGSFLASSTPSSSRRPSGDTTFNQQQQAHPSASRNIQFSDLVRISGGIRSSAEKERRQQRHQRRTSSPHRRGSLPSSVTPSRSRSRSSLSGPSGSVTPIYSSSPTGNFLPPTGETFLVHHPSPAKPGLSSRPGSFRSEISRASTPASLYAPLSQPSITAPSPTRAFYLTIKRGDGQVSYREMVKKQLKEAKASKKRQRRQRRAAAAARERDFKGSEGDDERTQLVSKPGKGKNKGSNWLCACFGRRRRSRGSRACAHEDGEDSDASASSGEDTGFEESDLEDLDPGSVRAGMRKTKSEMEVLFGRAPWRWLKLNYWRYRLSRSGRGEGLDEDEERYIDGTS